MKQMKKTKIKNTQQTIFFKNVINHYLNEIVGGTAPHAPQGYFEKRF